MKKLKVNLSIGWSAVLWAGLVVGLSGCGLTGKEKLSTEQSIEKGKELYLSYGCAVCHGKNADGNSPNAQKYSPPPIDFHDPNAYHHGKSKEMIRNTIRFGVAQENSVMPAFSHITDEEMEHLVNFLISFQTKH